MTNKKMRQKLIVVIVSLFSLFLVLGSVVSYAWLSTTGRVTTTDGQRKFARLGMKLDLLFDMLEPSVNGVILTKSNGETVTFDQNAEWGTERNPYIISDIRHLQNLSILQEIGYFYDLFIQDNYNDGTYAGTKNVPYFLVCTPNGTPVTIEGGDVKFSPIGSDKYPFIGYIGGSFKDGTTQTNGGTSTVSTLQNINVETTTDVTDVGLFGTIAYLGDDKFDSNGDLKTGNINGMPSTVKDLLLSDVHVTIKEHSWIDVVRHLFTFWEVSDQDVGNVPHENHHIGIFAGHVELANIENISVYYSSEDQIAIDLLHVTSSNSGNIPNYLSVTGIMGYIYSMNPDYNGSTIGLGSGTGNSDYDVSTGGVGSGGGTLTGMGRGYVVASSIYDNYRYATTDLDGQTVYLYYDANMNSGSGIVLHKKGENYYLEDDMTPVTFDNGTALFGGYQTDNYFIRTETIENDEVVYHYYFKNETTEIVKFNATDMLLLEAKDESGNPLCTRYIRKRLLWGTQVTNNYYFYDGVFTFALSSPSDSISDTWDNDSVDSFTLSGRNDSYWKANTAKGNKAMVGYVHQITNNADLDAAIDAGKQLFIMKDLGNSDIFVMSLYSQSAGASSGRPDTRFYTPGLTLSFDNVLDPDGVTQSIISSYEGGLDLPSNMSSEYNTLDKFKQGINDQSLKVINLGAASETLSINEIEQQYKITSTATGLYSYYYTDNGAPAIIGSDNKVHDFYEYEGFYYYTSRVQSFLITSITYYTYYYRNADGDDVSLGNETTTAPTNYFTSQGTDSNGINLYSRGQNGNHPLVNMTNMELHNTSSPVTTNGGMLSVQSSNSYNYFYRDRDGSIKSSAGTILTDLVQNGTTASGDSILYRSRNANYTGVLLDRYPMYTLSNGSNFLRVMNLQYSQWSIFGGNRATTYYAIWNGTDSGATTGSNFTYNNSTPTSNNSKNSTIVFNNDGTCYVQFTYNDIIRYVSYSTENSGSFVTSTNNQSANTKLYIYSVEGMQDIEYGRITFDPKDPEQAVTLSADEFILWPQTTWTGTQLGNNAFMTDSVYTIKQLGRRDDDLSDWQKVSDADVLSFSEGWKNSLNEQLTSSDLHKKFSLGSGIGGSTYTISLFNGSLSLGDDNTIRAPIGSAGVEADIPIGCVAFRINKEGESKIRVIVSVPQSYYFYNESGNYLDYSADYYFALWTDNAAGADTFKSFRLNKALEAFEIPRSSTYQPGTTPSGSDNTATNVSKFINVTYNGNPYRCYLNGKRVLVGYEFTVSQAGVYIMGCTQPMEIVYFSADGTASAGRDGSGGSKLGSIDFVYDYNNKVITVSDETPAGVEDDYNYYYASLALLYTNNSEVINGTSFININDCQVYVRREIAGVGTGSERSRIVYRANSTHAPYIKFTRYASLSDEIVRGEDGARVNN